MSLQNQYFYYHWSMDKPCTTNGTYGFFDRHYYKDPKWKPNQLRKTGALGYVRPFETVSHHHVPDISDRKTRELPPEKLKENMNRFDVMRNYHVGHVSVIDKTKHPKVLPGMRKYRHTYVPAPHRYTPEPFKRQAMWPAHQVNIVQIKNYPAPRAAYPYRADTIDCPKGTCPKIRYPLPRRKINY